jgi:signal transduction histidine kinase
MLRTLYGKLAVVLLALLGLLAALYIGLTLLTTRVYVQEITQKLNHALAEHVVAAYTLLQDGQVNEPALADIFHMLMVINPSIEVYLLDPEGRILAHAAPPGKLQRQRIAVQPLRDFLQGSDRFPILGDDPRQAERQKVFSVAPVPAQGPLQGYLYVVLASEAYDSVAHRLQSSYILRLSTAAVAAGLVFALGLGLLLFNLFTRRLRRLSAAMQAFEHSDFTDTAIDTTLPTRHHVREDEIGRLTATFGAMAARITQHVQALRHTDALRRELVANVFHDLRTPLAALRGYLETLQLKEAQLSAHERRHYLGIAAAHSQRLSKLVGELFELAKLEAHETQVHAEAFSLAELVQDAVQQFQIIAQKRQVRLSAVFPEELPYVSADLGLIARVLENLLENALRYTPADGTVTITLNHVRHWRQVRATCGCTAHSGADDDGVVIADITDTGSGIAPAQLPYIFERFYRAQHGTPDEPEGLGLGLAITKRILELHGSCLTVHSVPQTGTTFTFHLPTCSPSCSPARFVTNL